MHYLVVLENPKLVSRPSFWYPEGVGKVLRPQRARIREVIANALKEEGIQDIRVFLFGSRARGEARGESDWDLFVLIDEECTPERARKLWNLLYFALHREFPHESFDIVVKSRSAFEMEKSVVNTLAHEVYLEGQEL